MPAAELSASSPKPLQTPAQIDTIAASATTIPAEIPSAVIAETIASPTAALNTEPVTSKKIIGRSGFKLPTMEEVRSGSYVPPVVIKEKEVLPTEAFKASDFKIYWNSFPIAKLSVGNDYLNPKFELVIDETIEKDQKQKLTDFIYKWLHNKINIVLKSLIDLKNLKEKNSSIKALAYQLYENNGVLKREQVSSYLKTLGQNERKILRELGVKFGRYHVFLYQLIKHFLFLLLKSK